MCTRLEEFLLNYKFPRPWSCLRLGLGEKEFLSCRDFSGMLGVRWVDKIDSTACAIIYIDVRLFFDIV